MNLLLYIAHQLSARQPPHAILAEEVPHVMGTGIKTTLQVFPPQAPLCALQQCTGEEPHVGSPRQLTNIRAVYK